MRQGSSTYNLITLVFLFLTVLVCLATTGILTETVPVPEALKPATDVPLPTGQVLPLWTASFTPLPTNTPLPTPTRTITPTNTATNTQTATSTLTPEPTDTPTFTYTPTPSSTFTKTFTPTNSPTITLTPSATGPTDTPTNTPAPFPFVVDTIQIRQDLNANCNLQAFGGNVFDLVNEPINGLQIAVTGPGLPSGGLVVTSGSDLDYGPGGWEAKVSDFLAPNQYTVQLRNVDGTPLSTTITQTFAGNCDGNLVLIRFKQIRPY